MVAMTTYCDNVIATMSLSSMIHLDHYLSLPYLVVVFIVLRYNNHCLFHQGPVLPVALQLISSQQRTLPLFGIITDISVLISQLPTSTNLCDQFDSMVYDLRWLSPSLVDLTVSDRCVAYQKCWCTTCLYQYVIASSSGGTGIGNNYFFYFYCKV